MMQIDINKKSGSPTIINHIERLSDEMKISLNSSATMIIEKIKKTLETTRIPRTVFHISTISSPCVGWSNSSKC